MPVVTYGSVCSGIEAATLAWGPLGWRTAWFSEIEPFPSKVLAYRWPRVPNTGDMRLLPDFIAAGLVEAPAVLIGGTPCQAFSVAGARRGMLDPRGMLSIKFIEVANAIDEQRPGRECVVCWENVPGVLSDKQNAFGCFLGALVGEDCELQPPGKRWSNAGYVSGPQRSAAWRVMDAQYARVAQRRRRVFVVASARDGFDPAAVLFESEGVRRDTPPSRTERQEVAGMLGSRTTGGGSPGSDEAMSGYMQPVNTTGAGFWQEGFGTLRAREQESHEHLICMSTGQAGAEIGVVGTTLNCNHEAPIVTTQYGPVAGSPTARHDSSPCADRGMNVIAFHAEAQPDQMNSSNETTTSQHAAIAFKPRQSADSRSIGAQKEIACTPESAGGGNNKQAIAYGWQVRRLTPLECERLQGVPDNHTTIPGAKDGPRYKAIGNSMAVPCIKWIGQRIEKELFK